MENIKEELRQMIKEKILSTIMEGKNSKKREKPVHPPRGPYQHKIKTYGKGGDATTINTQRRREGREQAAQLDENEIHTAGLMAAGLLGTGIIGLGIEALRQKFLFPKNIAKLKADLVPTQKFPTVGRGMTPEREDYLTQYKSHDSSLSGREAIRARAEGRTPRLITPEMVEKSMQRAQNSGLSAVTNRTNKKLS